MYTELVTDSDKREFSALVRRALLRDAVVGQLDSELATQYFEALEFVWVKAGDAVMRQGDPSDNLATVILGRVKVEKIDDEGHATTLITLGHGQTIGEMGLVADQPRTADVIAVRDTLLATLSREAFEQLLQKNPLAFNQQFVRPIINRLQDQLNGVTKINVALLTMVLLPASDSVSIQPLAAQLSNVMNDGIATCLHIDETYIADNLGEIDDTNPQQDRRLSEWLGMQEAKYDVVIYTADSAESHSAESPWLKRCLRQADKIVVVGDGAGTPVSAESIPSLKLKEASHQERYLLLLQPNSSQRPQGTTAWLDTFEVTYYYHLCLDSAENVQRVARLLANRGVGLVMRGAGVNGTAHIGVYQLLSERGIPVDAICGASSGSIISTCIADGWDAEQFEQRLANPPKVQWTLPFSAISSGNGMQEWFDRVYGKLKAEDIWLPNFFPIYNLRTNKLETVDRGQISYFMRAATALPGISPPLVDGHDIYVDGGVANFMPIDLMRNRPDIQSVIAIDILPAAAGDKAEKPPYTYDGRLSGWKVLWSRINPFAKRQRYVDIISVVIKSSLAAGIQSHRKTRELADFTFVLIIPDKPGILNFDQIAETANFGYAEAERLFAGTGLEVQFGEQSHVQHVQIEEGT